MNNADLPGFPCFNAIKQVVEFSGIQNAYSFHCLPRDTGMLQRQRWGLVTSQGDGVVRTPGHSQLHPVSIRRVRFSGLNWGYQQWVVLRRSTGSAALEAGQSGSGQNLRAAQQDPGRTQLLSITTFKHFITSQLTALQCRLTSSVPTQTRTPGWLFFFFAKRSPVTAFIYLFPRCLEFF